MRVTIDVTSASAGGSGGDVFAWDRKNWIEWLQREARGEEIRTQEFGTAVRFFGSALLDFMLRGSAVLHASPSTPCAPRQTKLTATLNDLSSWLMPEMHPPQSVRTQRIFAERILNRCDGLIAVSESVREEATNLLGIDASRITVI